MNYKVLIIDDEVRAVELLKQLLGRLGDMQIEGCNSIAAAATLLKENSYDLLFLDIGMPGTINGLDFIKKLSEERRVPPFVFVSGMREHMPEAFHVQPFDFILKPIDPEVLGETVRRFKKRFAPRASEITLTTNFGKESFEIGRIVCVETTGNRSLEMTLDDGRRRVISNASLVAFLQKLPRNFVRVHRQRVVNLDYVHRINGGIVIFKCHDRKVAIGETYKKDLWAAYNDYRGE
ncbi:MAG: LytR/AlgR family response regulator transcription factor [Mangrovibacterium sp.]